jgi:hypothetical protein
MADNSWTFQAPMRERIIFKAQLLLEEHIWRAFHAACLEHQTNASKEVEQFMRRQLTQWDSPQDVPEHRTS